MYVESSGCPSLNLFKLWPWGTNWPLPPGEAPEVMSGFYIYLDERSFQQNTQVSDPELFVVVVVLDLHHFQKRVQILKKYVHSGLARSNMVPCILK